MDKKNTARQTNRRRAQPMEPEHSLCVSIFAQREPVKRVELFPRGNARTVPANWTNELAAVGSTLQASYLNDAESEQHAIRQSHVRLGQVAEA